MVKEKTSIKLQKKRREEKTKKNMECGVEWARETQ